MLFFSEYGDLMYSDGENTFLIDDYGDANFDRFQGKDLAGTDRYGNTLNKDYKNQPKSEAKSMDGNGKVKTLLERIGRRNANT